MKNDICYDWEKCEPKGLYMSFPRDAWVVLMCLNISACTLTQPSFGDRLLVDGESRIEIAKQWEQGRNDSKKGEGYILDGRKLVERGRSELRQGEEQIASGNIAVQTNRQAYQAISQIPEQIKSPDDIAKRATRLKDIAKAWKAGETLIVHGNERIKRGNQRIIKGEAKISTGQKLIETGRKKMQASEKRYIPAET